MKKKKKNHYCCKKTILQTVKLVKEMNNMAGLFIQGNEQHGYLYEKMDTSNVYDQNESFKK